MTTLASRRQYRGRVKKSLCRKKTVRKCRKVKGCKNTKKGKRSIYCRKKHNKHLKQKGGAGYLPEERDKCLNNYNNAHTTGKINDDEFNKCKKACPYAFGGRRTRKQRGGDSIEGSCFKDCIEAVGGTTDGVSSILCLPLRPVIL